MPFIIKYRHVFFAALLLAVTAAFSGCVAAALIPLAGQAIYSHQSNSDAEVMAQQQKITNKFNNSPDSDAWYAQRQDMAKGLGDRVFDKDFARVFDSLVLAMASMELRVNNMERQSGYITASGITLPPTEAKTMRREAVLDWCAKNGFDASVLDKKFNTAAYRRMGEMIDTDGMMAKYDKMQKSLTFQLIKMSDNQTKVKLRFSDVYYPAEVETYYKMVWEAVDKQIFVDKTIEDKVEERK